MKRGKATECGGETPREEEVTTAQNYFGLREDEVLWRVPG